MKKPTAEQQAKAKERKARFKTLWKQVADMPETQRVQLANKLGFVNCEGRVFSLGNTMLIALQCPRASVLGGFQQWLKQGRAVQKGQHGAMIWVPIGGKSVNEPTTAQAEVVLPEESHGDSDTRFVVGTVFDISQTAPLEEAA